MQRNEGNVSLSTESLGPLQQMISNTEYVGNGRDEKDGHIGCTDADV